MTFTNLQGEREANTGNSEDYKKRIKKYMGVRGYAITGDSSIDGSLEDLIFKRPLADGQKETRVEAKFTELSLFDLQFLDELKNHFIKYMNSPIDNRFFLKIFVKKCKSIDKWKKIFDKGDNNAINELKQKIESKLEEEKLVDFIEHSFDNFLNFIMDCHVIQADYDRLNHKIDKLSKSKEFKLDKKLTEENQNLEYENEKLTANMMKVLDFPKVVWIAKAKKIENMKKFWEENYEELIYPTRDHIISLSSMDKNKKIKSYIINDTIEKKMFEHWMDYDDPEKVNILKNLIERYIVQKGRKIGMRFNRKLNSLFYPHLNKSRLINKIGKRKVSRIFQDKEGKIRFVEHNCVNINILFFNKEFYVVLDNTRLFTENGEKAVDGEIAKKLHYKFPNRFAYNNSEKSKFLYWKKLFSFDYQTLNYTMYFKISKPIEIHSPVTSIRGEKYTLQDVPGNDLSEYFLKGEEDEF